MCVHYFTLLFQEGQDGIYANVHKLEHHPGTPVNGYVLSETECVALKLYYQNYKHGLLTHSSIKMAA